VSKTENDPHFVVRPRYYAVRITQEYVRSIAGKRTPGLLPKFHERTGVVLGVEILTEDRELTGRMAKLGEYVVFTPAGPEVHWDLRMLETKYEIEEGA